MWGITSRNPSPERMSPGTHYTRSLLMACDQPLLHPYTQLRIYETFAESIGVDPSGTPPEQRTVVVTLPRNDGTQRNGGRGCGTARVAAVKGSERAVLPRRQHASCSTVVNLQAACAVFRYHCPGC